MNDTPATGMRLDKWLVYTRFCKTRGIAADITGSGQLRIDGAVVGKSHFTVRPEMTLTFPYGGHVRVVRVLGLPTRRGSAVEAATFYDDLDPPADHNRLTPRPDTKASQTASRDPGSGRPTKRDRRRMETFKSND